MKYRDDFFASAMDKGFPKLCRSKLLINLELSEANKNLPHACLKLLDEVAGKIGEHQAAADFGAFFQKGVPVFCAFPENFF